MEMPCPMYRRVIDVEKGWAFGTLRRGVIRHSFVIFLLLLAGAVNIPGAVADEPVPLVAAIIPGSIEPDLKLGAMGLNADLVRAAFKKAGLETSIDLLPWRRAKMIAEVGRAAALFTCSYRSEREQYFLYSSRIRTIRKGIYTLVQNSDAELRSLSDIGNKSVGVTAGYNLQDELDDAGIAYNKASNDSELVSMLFTGRSHYIYAAEDIVSQILGRLNRRAQVRFFHLNSDDLFVCFSRKWPGVAGIAKSFELGLKGIRADGTFDQIFKRYR